MLVESGSEVAKLRKAPACAGAFYIACNNKAGLKVITLSSYPTLS